MLLEEISDRYKGGDPIIEVALALGRSRIDPSSAQMVFILDGPLDTDLYETLVAWGNATSRYPSPNQA